MKRKRSKIYWIIIYLVALAGICGMFQWFTNNPTEAKETFLAGLMVVSILFLCLAVPHNLARLIHSKDKHHSGMDIDQKKEAYERHRKNG